MGASVVASVGVARDSLPAARTAFVGDDHGRAALLGFVRTALSDYRKLRGELGFTTHEEAEMLALLSRHGFAAERSHPNFGHNQARMTFSARRVE